MVGNRDTQCSCCIVGGGPAGLMLGLLLARAGIEVIVLEKHADFLRDFRGDTIHPSTLELMHELGCLERFLERPHARVESLGAQIGTTDVQLADFTGLSTECKFIAFMPQWEFLDFVATEAKQYPTFRLKMRAQAETLITDDTGHVTGVSVTTPEGSFDVRSDLLVACDGRHSTVRPQTGLEVEELGAPMDILWFRLSKGETDPGKTLGRLDAGRMMVLIDRNDYWQCAFVIPKGGYAELKARGLAEFRAEITTLSPFFADRVAELKSWEDLSLLTVAVNRLQTWHRPGVLCIGDAAHAMSPIGGVGINLAIQDAVATANLLWKPLADGTVSEADLAKVQARREWPTKATQKFQVVAQNRVIGRVLSGEGTSEPPALLRFLTSLRGARRLLARAVGVGLRPEHVQSPDRSDP